MHRFARLFCLEHDLAEPAYAQAALRACLHRPARWGYSLINRFAPHFFAAELDLINGISWLTSPEELEFDLDYYSKHPFNQSRWRHQLRLGICPQKVQQLVWRTLRASAAPSTSATPFATGLAPAPAPVASAASASARPAAESSDPFAHFPLHDHSGALER